MKNITIVLLILGLVFMGCSGGADTSVDDTSLSGTITIQQYGETVTTAYTYIPLIAFYTGTEEVDYQWKRGADDIGENVYHFTPEDTGQYTVTVSFPGKNPRTSATVNVVVNPNMQDLTGTVLFFVDSELDPSVAAETGQLITAQYEGPEVVSFQWFKDGAPVQSSALISNAVYTPTEAGSYTVRLTSGGYFPKFSDPVEVTGQSLITITFNLNGPGGFTNPTRIIAPGEAITARRPLPSPPEWNGFTCTGWYTQPTGGTKLTDQTPFDETTMVYAHWIFGGGTPYINEEENTLVHENPLMEAGQQFAGTISEEDGTITFSAGAFQYRFPSGAEFNVGSYAYFIVRFELGEFTPSTTNSDPKAGSGVRLRQYNNATTYGGVDNEWPWLTNTSSSGIRFPLSGAGDTGGFSILYNGATDGQIEVRITSITFYKLPLYTVTFDLNEGAGTVPGETGIYQGSTLGAQFPANPTREDYTFICWKNQTGAIVTATTPIMGSWTLTAQWVLTEEMGDEWMELITTTATSAPVYVFDIDTDTLGSYDRIIVKIKSDAAVSGRLRAWGVYPLSGFTFTGNGTRPGMQNTAGVKLLTNGGIDNFSHNGAWTEYELELNAIAATNQTDATGLLAIAFGVISPAGGSGQRNYYVKDIVLANTNKSKQAPALRPDDSRIWSGNGKSAYVTGNGSDVVTRTLLPYE